jgi:hypothetical protein
MSNGVANAKSFENGTDLFVVVGAVEGIETAVASGAF